MTASARPITLDELFGSPADSTNRDAVKATDSSTTTTITTTTAAHFHTSRTDNAVNESVTAGLSTALPTRDVSPSPPSSYVRELRSGHAHDGSGSDGSITPLFRGVQRTNAEYSALSPTTSREPTLSSFSNPVSATSRASASGNHISSFTASAVNRLPRATPSTSGFSDVASDGGTTVRSDKNDVFTTCALLRRFLEERRRIATASSPTAGKSLPHSVAHGSQVFDVLHSAHLVPSVVPAEAAAEANATAAMAAKPEQGPYLIESTYMRAATVAAVLKRQKAERHAAYSDAHPFFRSQAPLTDAPVTTAVRTRLPVVLDMPLYLRCPMCQKHDAMCNLCHRRWKSLQASYRDETAVHCYSTLDVNRRGAVGLLTAALGTGSFLEMMSIADGLTLTQTRVQVTPATLEFLLKSCGRVLSTVIEDRLTSAEDASLPSRAMWLKVAHVGCLFGQRDVLHALWLRCRGGCSYAAQITTNGLHALELLSEPYEPALRSIMNRCSALREYLLWARIMQCLAVKAAAVDGAETTQLCAELRQTGSWVGVWSEALLAYVKGDKQRCVELCDELLHDAAPTPSPTPPPAPPLPLVEDGEVDSATPRVDMTAGISTASFSSSAQETTPTPPPPPRPPSQLPPATSTAAAEFSMRPAMDLDRIRGLKELALRAEAPLPHLEAAEEELPTTPVRQSVVHVDPVTDTAASVGRGDSASAVRVPLRRLPFSLVRRVLSYCDAIALLRVHEATVIPLMRWVVLARLKCLPTAQWARLLTGNRGYVPLLQALCTFVPPPTQSREEREAAEEDTTTTAVAGVLSQTAASTDGTETHASAAVAMACPPFQPLHVSVLDIEDLGHITVKATTLSHKTAQGAVVPAEPLTVGQWLLQSLFGRATSLINESKYLVLSRVCRLTAPDAAANLLTTDVSAWECEVVQQWEVDAKATIRWCTYVQQHAGAEKLL